MKFIMVVEGATEKRAIGDFCGRWLNAQGLTQRVGVKAVEFDGWAKWQRELKTTVWNNLEGPGAGDVIGVIGLLDLYGPTFYPSEHSSADDRYAWGKRHFETLVGHDKFKMFFAVHELEAWLLSQPDILPAEVRRHLPTRPPETINFNKPPARLLDSLYRQHLNCNYKKVTDGAKHFKKLDPAAAAAKCPRLNEMFHEMLAMARAARL